MYSSAFMVEAQFIIGLSSELNASREYFTSLKT